MNTTTINTLPGALRAQALAAATRCDLDNVGGPWWTCRGCGQHVQAPNSNCEPERPICSAKARRETLS